MRIRTRILRNIVALLLFILILIILLLLLLSLLYKLTFPDPVAEMPIMSLPLRAMGQPWLWMGDAG